MNKEIGKEYLKFYIDSNGNIDLIDKFIKNKNITKDTFNSVLKEYLDYLKERYDSTGKMNKLYLEYLLKFKNNNVKNNRKEVGTIINIIFNYIKEDKYNIKEYVEKNDLDYNSFKKFINNCKNYYLTEMEKQLLKTFLKRENDFNNNNIEKVKVIVNKIFSDLNNINKYDIFDYYIELSWDKNLLIYFINNNKEEFSDITIKKVEEYFNKYNIKDIKIKLNDFISLIRNKYPELNRDKIDSLIKTMNKYNMPYNIYLFEQLLKSE